MPAVVLLAFALSAVAPLPAPGQAGAGQLASGCIYYYRLQTTGVPGGSAACEAAGYGLDFMRAHWKDIEALEAKRKAEVEAEVQRGRAGAAARAEAASLRGPCEAMILDGGPGPDGGQALCDLAGFTRVRVARRAARARMAASRQNPWGERWMLALVAAALVGLAAFAGWRRRRR